MEFTLDPSKDSIDTIAAEMVEELGLTFAVADLARYAFLLYGERERERDGGREAWSGGEDKQR